ASEDGVVLVLPRRRVTGRTALLETDDALESEVPAPRPLAEVSAHGPEIPNLRRCDRPGSLGEPRVCGPDFGVLLEGGERDERADTESLRARALDAVETADA